MRRCSRRPWATPPSPAPSPRCEQPAGPQVQRLIPLAIIGAGLIYVSGEQRGWWGGDEEAKAAKTTGGAERLAKVSEERAANLRTRHTLNNQVLGTMDNLARLAESGKREDAEKAVGFGSPLLGVLEGLAVGEAQRPVKEAAQDLFGEGFQTAVALTETREESIALCKSNFATAAAGIGAVIAPAAAPAAAPGAPGRARTAPRPGRPSPRSPRTSCRPSRGRSTP